MLSFGRWHLLSTFSFVSGNQTPSPTQLYGTMRQHTRQHSLFVFKKIFDNLTSLKSEFLTDNVRPISKRLSLPKKKRKKKMPGDDRRGRVKREITKLAPFALVTVPKSSFFLTCLLIHAQAKWPCHEGVFLIPNVPHYWKCWLHSLSESWKKKSYTTDKIPMVWPFTWNFLVVRFVFRHFTK